MNKNQKIKIGIFDSGLGGLTVFKSLASTYRQSASFVYLGDLAHLPYGDKSKESIIKYSDKICKFLLSKKVDVIIIACNSASSVAGQYLLQKYCDKLPIIETIHPSIRAVYTHIENSDNRENYSVGIIGTETTINSKAYENELIDYIKNENINIDLAIKSIACPLFVPIVEEGWENTDIAHQIATKYLSQFQNKLDTVILACTHYPILLNTLEFVFNKLGHTNLNFIESGNAIAFDLYGIADHFIFKNEYHLKLEEKNSILVKPEDEFYITDTPHQFNELANRFLGANIHNIQLISL